VATVPPPTLFLPRVLKVVFMAMLLEFDLLSFFLWYDFIVGEVLTEFRTVF
jgi:hypothetical protein